MKRSYLGALLFALPFCATAMAQTAPSYQVIDLGEAEYTGKGMVWADRPTQTNSNWPSSAPCVGGRTNVYATPILYTINSLQIATGAACTANLTTHAGYWTWNPETPVTYTDVGTLPGAQEDYSFAYGANESGDVVGDSQTAYTTPFGSTAYHAFLWNGGHMTDLGAIAGNNYNSQANAVNDSHEVIGTTQAISSITGGILERVFLYTSGKMYNLSFYETGGATALLSSAKWIDCQGNIAASGFPATGAQVLHSYLLIRQGATRNCPAY